MAISINTTELLKVLDFTPPEQNIMLVGKHGIGKSRIIADYFAARQRKVVTLFLGQMSDPGDIIGLPAIDRGTTQTGLLPETQTLFHPPWWFPVDGKPIVLFLDELNRARPEILQCVMDLTLNKTIAGRTLPAGTQIISAVNEGEEYQLTDLDPALVSRFNIYTFNPSVSEWLLWASARKIDGRIIGFIEKNNDCLDGAIAGDGSLEKSPDRRAWERVSQLIAGVDNIDRIAEKAIAGIVGNAAALKFSHFTREAKGVNPLLVLEDFIRAEKALEKLPLHELSALNDGLFRTLELESEQDVLKKHIGNLELYLKWLQSTGRNEAFAHWTTLFDTTAYPKAKIAVMTWSPYIFQTMIEFIKTLKV
jgi:hypothetical protein